MQCLPNCLIVRITGGNLLKIKIPRPHPKLTESEEGLEMPVYMPQVILVIRQVRPMLGKCCCEPVLRKNRSHHNKPVRSNEE